MMRGLLKALLSEEEAIELCGVGGVIRELNVGLPLTAAIAVVRMGFIFAHELELWCVRSVATGGRAVVGVSLLVKRAWVGLRGLDEEAFVVEALIREEVASEATDFADTRVADGLKERVVGEER